MVMSTSSEFITLCRSQVALLSQGLGAALSVVYLTEELVEGDAEARLIPVVAYPEAVMWDAPALPLDEKDSDVHPLLLSEISVSPSPQLLAASQMDALDYPILPSTQLVLPLVHEGVLMGLLVTSRKDRPWNERERGEIERIAQTLLLARLLDQRREWFEQQLGKQQRLQAKQRDLLDNLLHQFRNPLTALRTFGKLLLKRFLPGDANRAVADSIVRESDRLQDLLQQFDRVIDLTWDEIEPQKTLPSAASLPLLPNTTKTALSAHSVLEPLLASVREIAEERNLHLEIDIPADLPLIQANAKALREVLSNLLDNALKYTPTGGKIYVQAGLVQDQLQGTAISNTGPRIPAKDLEHIFERHYRGVQLHSSIPGTGLGLAIARELVEAMQGKIQVFSPAHLPTDNVSSPGATFIVWLPVAG